MQDNNKKEKIYIFKDSLYLGKEGEKIIYKYFKETNKYKQIIDVSNNKNFQEKDIDFILIDKYNQEIYIEVKTDYYDTGNIFFEIISSIETLSIGCMFKTDAHFLCYYFIKTKELYIFNVKEYIKFIMENIDRFKLKKVKNKTYTSLGCLIPKTFIENNFNKYKKVIFG